MRVRITRTDGELDVEVDGSSSNYRPDVMAEVVTWAHSLWSWLEDETVEVDERDVG